MLSNNPLPYLASLYQCGPPSDSALWAAVPLPAMEQSTAMTSGPTVENGGRDASGEARNVSAPTDAPLASEPDFGDDFGEEDAGEDGQGDFEDEDEDEDDEDASSYTST